VSKDLPTANLSIQDLPSVLTHLFARAQRPLSPATQAPVGLFIRYLRRKPGRGLAIIYAADAIRSHATHVSDPHSLISLVVDEAALTGTHLRFSASQARETPVEVLPSGVLHAPELALCAQSFPVDARLPALAASCDMTPQSPLFTALQTVARTQLQDSEWQLDSAQATPVRYKPANRCVIRYHLELEHPVSLAEQSLTIFGKVYADPTQAKRVQLLQQQLYDEQEQSGMPLLPRPLAIIEPLGLTLHEAVQPSQRTHDIWGTVRAGTWALRPQLERGRGGEVIRVIIPEEELRLTAQALARLHTSSSIHPHAATPRTGTKEAQRTKERAQLLAGHNPEQAVHVQQLAQQLASRLEALQPESYRPAHGGFKASQLLFHSHQVIVTDFDGFCLADPALDVGYFLAYLRPSGLWYQRAGMRQWFETAADIFRQSYRLTMKTQGVALLSIDGIISHAKLYEAALIFKIATRRINRLNGPRSQELAAMLSEISSCLS